MVSLVTATELLPLRAARPGLCGRELPTDAEAAGRAEAGRPTATGADGSLPLSRTCDRDADVGRAKPGARVVPVWANTIHPVNWGATARWGGCSAGDAGVAGTLLCAQSNPSLLSLCIPARASARKTVPVGGAAWVLRYVT
jgi:hypothetical protein